MVHTWLLIGNLLILLLKCCSLTVNHTWKCLKLDAVHGFIIDIYSSFRGNYTQMVGSDNKLLVHPPLISHFRAELVEPFIKTYLFICCCLVAPINLLLLELRLVDFILKPSDIGIMTWAADWNFLLEPAVSLLNKLHIISIDMFFKFKFIRYLNKINDFHFMCFIKLNNLLIVCDSIILKISTHIATEEKQNIFNILKLEYPLAKPLPSFLISYSFMIILFWCSKKLS